jgi:4-hydroxybenzoate-CoA ligase
VNGNAVEFFLDRHIREERGGRTAFTDPTRTLTYAALHARAAGFATGLRRAGIGRERRLALLLLDTVDFPVAFWGALRAGVVPVPINTLLPAELLRYILADSRAEGLVVSAPLLPSLPPLLAGLPDLRLVVVANPDGSPPSAMEPGHRPFEAFVAEDDATPPVPASPDEVAFWLYSSATTGAPKGARHVHGSLRATADGYAAEVLGIGPEDVMFSVAKLFFAYGLGNSMTFPMAVGARAVLLPDRPTPAAVLATMRRYRPTLFAGVPTLYAALLADPALGPGAGSDRLRRCISAGEALPAAIGERWSATVGTDILDGIGSTEMLHIFLSNRPDRLRYGTSGVPVPGYAARVVDEAGRDVPDGETGELWVSGPSAAEGYWNQRAKSRRTFAGEWTRTGDVYVREADGMFRYCGRADDMFKVSGIWVSPFEVEAALVTDPAVLEAAVVAGADADGLLKPRAFVVLRDGVDPDPALRDRLREHVKAQVGPWKYPRWIEAVDALPKTATGKVQRYRLRAPP